MKPVICKFHNECLCDQCCYDCSVIDECTTPCPKDVLECIEAYKKVHAIVRDDGIKG